MELKRWIMMKIVLKKIDEFKWWITNEATRGQIDF